MKRAGWLGAALLVIGLAAAAPAIQSAMVGNRSDPAPIVADEQPAERPRSPTTRAATPMAERVATLGILNKRNGLSRDLNMKPGQAVLIGDAVIRLKACEQTEPWEREQLTGAFVQLIVRGADTKWRKTFSGWLYKESPSLNVVEHPIYDVWVKDCKMRHPDVGPDTVVLPSPDAGSSAPPRRKKSSSPNEGDSAESSNAT